MSTYGLSTEKRKKSHVFKGRDNKKDSIFKVFLNGEDVTPKPLDPDVDINRTRNLTIYDASGAQKTASQLSISGFNTTSLSKFYSQLHTNTIGTESAANFKSFISVYVDDVVIEPELRSVDSGESDYSLEQYRISEPMPSEILLTLTETTTFFILDLPSKTVLRESPEALLVEADNKLYEFLTSEKGRNRKVLHSEAQTIPKLQKTRVTEALRPKRRHNEAFAAEWDMYDTYKAIDEGTELPVVGPKPKKNLEGLSETEVQQYIEEELIKLNENNRFYEALCVIERLLANNNYNEKQKRYRGLSDPDPFREDIEYKYRLNLLWTFSNNLTTGKCVTAISINPYNEDVIAVSYGKFYFTDKANGMLLVWNIKNPVQPERIYNFESPITHIKFSNQNYNLIAVAFYSGELKIIDISRRNLSVVGKSSSDSHSYYALWSVEFFTGEYYKGLEYVGATSQDGRILSFWPTDSTNLRTNQSMRITRPEGRLKGLQTMRRCVPLGISISRYPAALLTRRHPVDSQIYYVASGEGVIYKCSKNYHHQHLEQFLAHDGPVYELQFSPFCNKLFLTCGDDWYVRIWAEGIDEPLVELTKAMLSVEAADWSPAYSTLIASISGTDIYLWDLQRKTYQPQSITNSPTNCRNTALHFTKSGRCLLIGDIEGHVHVFSLEDMPFPAFYQDTLLVQALKRALITQPDLTRKLNKLGSLNFDASEFKTHFR